MSFGQTWVKPSAVSTSFQYLYIIVFALGNSKKNSIFCFEKMTSFYFKELCLSNFKINQQNLSKSELNFLA